MQVERPLLDRDKDRKVTIENMIVINIHYGGIFLFFYPFVRRLYEKKNQGLGNDGETRPLKLRFITAPIKTRH